MDIALLIAAYDSGHYNLRMGQGPLRLKESGILDNLRSQGHTIHETELHPDQTFSTEISTAFALHRLGAEAAAEARSNGMFPLLFSGNCNHCIGPVTGAQADSILWFDAHGDYNTTDTTTTGFLDGMGLNILAGNAFHAASQRTPGFRPIQPVNIVHVGGRDFDPEEDTLMRSSGMVIISPDEVYSSGIQRGLDALLTRERRLHIHFDFDVLDPSIGTANPFPTPGGLRLEEVTSAIRAARKQLPVVSASLAAYEPAVDPEGKMIPVAAAVLDALVN
jgi:arginase